MTDKNLHRRRLRNESGGMIPHPLDDSEPAVELLRLAGRAMVYEAMKSGQMCAADENLGLTVGVDCASRDIVSFCVFHYSTILGYGKMTVDEVAKHKTI